MRLGVVSSSEVGRLQIAGSSDEVCDMRRAVRRRGLGVMASRGRACRGPPTCDFLVITDY